MMELPQDMQAWLVLIARIALPVFILFVAFGPKIDAWLSSWGPAYSKDELLRHWKATKGSKGPKPSELSNLTMVTAETAPLLFQKPDLPDRSKQKKKGEKVDKSEKAEAEKADKADKAHKMAEKSAYSERTDPEDLAKTDKSSANQQELNATDGSVKPDDAAKQMHFESLMELHGLQSAPAATCFPASRRPTPS